MTNENNQNSQKQILVAGDAMLDEYWSGDADRISPEAPVPVVAIVKTEKRLGGAANVALNVAGMAVPCTLASLIGADDNGRWVEAELKRRGVSTLLHPTRFGFPTIQKIRLLARHQQIVRIDLEGGPAQEDVDDFTFLAAKRIQAGDIGAVIFSDYMKHAMRLSALMHLPVTYILTHDSIGVGEDGPTHEPVEQLIALRSIPNMKVFRPADGKETTAAWISALTGTSPTCLVLTRQNLPQYENSGLEALKGGYILSDSEKETPDVLLIASGSEVEQCMQAKEILKTKGVDARVVSMPCMEEFEKQPQAYKDEVLPPEVKARVCVEAASPYSWYKYAGDCGEIIGMTTFGASGPANKLFELFGFTADNVVEKAFRSLNKV